MLAGMLYMCERHIVRINRQTDGQTGRRTYNEMIAKCQPVVQSVNPKKPTLPPHEVQFVFSFDLTYPVRLPKYLHENARGARVIA